MDCRAVRNPGLVPGIVPAHARALLTDTAESRLAYLDADPAEPKRILDIGTGIPTSPNLHETARALAADTRVIYADNDPIFLAHGRAAPGFE